MRRALDLAALGLGRTSPNPAVGAVVVAKGVIVGEGWHRRAGEPHAEPIALQAAGDDARGATLYVTLEPCCHQGRTPPCTEAIIEAGIARVAYACQDCDDRCCGRGAQELQSAGIETSCGPLTQQALRLNEAYFKHKQTGLPFVTLKMACSLDGKTATRTGDSRWVTGPQARELVHRMRDRADAVMVGIGTVLADDPQLTTRLEGPDCRDALRVVVDSGARTPPDARVIGSSPAPGCIIAVGQAAADDRVGALQAAGAQVVTLPQTAEGRVDLRALMARLGQMDVMGVLAEGGPTLAAAMVQGGLVDKIVLFYAPKLVGGASAPTALDGTGVEVMADAQGVRITGVERVGDDIMVEGYPCLPDS